jgi:YVTN family beta-propeller protein
MPARWMFQRACLFSFWLLTIIFAGMRMRQNRLLALVVAGLGIVLGHAASAADDATVGGPPSDLIANLSLGGDQTLMFNGWKLSPAGKATQLAGDMPTRMLVSADGKYVLTATGGYTEHGISVVEVATGKLVDHVKVPATFAGMCIDHTGKHVLLSAGGINSTTCVYSFGFDDGHLKAEPGLAVPAIPREKRFIGGLAAGTDGSVFIANIADNKVYRVNADSSGAKSAEVGYRPCAIGLSPDGTILAVANWGDRSVTLLDSVSMKSIGTVKVGSHPAAVAWTSDGRIFVANAGGNTVSAVSVKRMAEIESIRTSLDFQVPVGSTPLALAVDSVGKRLYVANADNNDVAVVDISDADESRVLGFIPTGWYPCALAASSDGKMLLVGTGKALDKFVPNSKSKTYIGNLLTGHVSMVDAPDPKALAGYTRQVLANTPQARSADQLAKNQSDVLANAFGKIKHVIYVIKENRTYDQVFGDMPQGNGDSSVTMFGEKITPNHHAIARDWVLLDNLYCNGEVSVDGHAWCDAAYASDFTTRSWTNTYSKRAGVDADDRLERSPGGYIWDDAMSHNLSFMSYGEGAAFLATPDQAPDVDDKEMNKGSFSKPWQQAAWKMDTGDSDYKRMDIFISDLHAAEKTGHWPALTVMSLPQDHTAGRRVFRRTPDACVASNDLAVGMLVDTVSHSRFWPDTAIFIIEDDAQNGQDHVDAHRTVGLVISPYTRRGVVDHTMYTTASMVRTIELMLHLPPMTQYDAAATPMFGSFSSIADLRPYTVLKQQVDLNAMNLLGNKGAKASAELDLSDLDRADPDKLNEILWDYFKPGVPMPAPVRSMIFVQ